MINGKQIKYRDGFIIINLLISKTKSFTKCTENKADRIHFTTAIQRMFARL